MFWNLPCANEGMPLERLALIWWMVALRFTLRGWHCNLCPLTSCTGAIGRFIDDTWDSSCMEWTGLGFCCECPRQHMVLHRLQKLLEFDKACCQFALVGSMFALLASFWCSTCGPSTKHLGVKTWCVLPICESWMLERCGIGVWVWGSHAEKAAREPGRKVWNYKQLVRRIRLVCT